MRLFAITFPFPIAEGSDKRTLYAARLTGGQSAATQLVQRIAETRGEEVKATLLNPETLPNGGVYGTVRCRVEEVDLATLTPASVAEMLNSDNFSIDTSNAARVAVAPVDVPVTIGGTAPEKRRGGRRPKPTGDSDTAAPTDGGTETAPVESANNETATEPTNGAAPEPTAAPAKPKPGRRTLSEV